MMTVLSGLLTGAVGKYASTLTLPACLFGLLLLGHQLIQQREAKQSAQATVACNAAWELEISKQQRDAAQHDADTAQSLLAGERVINEGLTNDLQKLRDQVDKARREAAAASAAAATDGTRCLSDSVLDLIGGHDGSKRSPASSKQSGSGGNGQSDTAGRSKAP